MTATAVGFFGEPFFCSTACSMSFFGRRDFSSCSGVNIERTELLPTFPAPGATTSSSYLEGPSSLKPTRKDIVTRRVLECPALTPRALFCVICATCRHSVLSDTKN